MITKTQAQTLKGFRDFLPQSMTIRNKVIAIFRNVFESYGFSEIQTPTLEYADVLTGKYGEEAEKLMYLFKDRGGRDVGLKYDLTVPLARVMSQYPELPKPFKRYQIQSAFRAENTQKGRYREFCQCDIDTVGTVSPLADAEILAVISETLRQLKFSNFKIRVNSRQLLLAITQNLSILQSIDKLDKKSKDEVILELKSKNISNEEIETIFQKLEKSQPNENLRQIISLAEKLGAKNIVFDSTLVRGLDYYTGAIFETVVTEPKMGSITGGGRYDNLIKTLGGPDLPAVGSTLGLDRICDIIEELNLWPDLSQTPTRALITSSDISVSLSRLLRTNSINTELYLDSETKLEKQLKYADQKGIPFVIIPSSETQVILKNMTNHTQKILDPKDLPNELTSL